jgi:hypothetical protein
VWFKKIFRKFVVITRDVLLASVVSEPEKKVFHNISRQYPRSLHCIVFFFYIYLVFLLFLVAKIAINTLNPGSFIVSARTEQVEYQPESIDPPRIPFHNATVYWEEVGSEVFDPLAPESAKLKSVSHKGAGSLQIHGKAAVIFSRIAKGPVHVKIRSTDKNSLYDDNDQLLCTLPEVVDLVLNDPAAMIAQGVTWKYTVDGPVIVGRVPTYDAYQQNGLLLDGEIHMIAKQLLSGNHYKVDPYKLQLGDGLQFTPTEPKTSGMITFDLDRGLQIVTIVEANSATINKFRGTKLKIRNNLWSKMGKDEELVITWAIMLAVPGSIVFFIRLLYFHSEMKLKNEQSSHDC